MKSVLYWLIVLIAITAIYGTYGLVADEWSAGNICPKILGIPACYIVLACFVGTLLGHVAPDPKGKWIYFIFAGIVTVIATTGTIGELAGWTKCPRTENGLPMCYISFAICSSLLITKYAFLRYYDRT